MPIDPTIALQVRPPQVASPVNVLMQTAQLQNAMAEAAYRGEEARNLALKRQEQLEDIEDQKAIQQAYGASGGDLDKVSAMVRGKVRPRNQQKLDDIIAAHKQKIATATQNELENAEKQTKAVGSAAQAVLSTQAPPVDGETPQDKAARDLAARSRAYQTARAALIRAGHVKPEDVPEQYPGDEWLQTHVNTALGAQQQITNELNRRKAEQEAAESKARIEGEQARTAEAKERTATEVQSRPSKVPNAAGLNPEQQSQADIRKAELEETKRHNKAMEQKAEEAKKLAPAQAAQIEAMKSAALAASKAQYLRDLKDPLVKPEDAWQQHVDRMDAAQYAYENEVAAATNQAVPHNNWARQEKAPAAPAGNTSVSTSTPAPTAKTGRQSKQFPESRLAAFAQANGISAEEARRRLTADGYTVTK